MRRISCVGAAIAMILLSFAKTPPGFIVGAFFSGLMTSLYGPASSSLIADLIGKELRVRAYAVPRFAVNLAFACGMTTAGLVAASSFFWLFGLWVLGHSPELLWLLCGLIGLAAAGLMLIPPRVEVEDS